MQRLVLAGSMYACAWMLWLSWMIASGVFFNERMPTEYMWFPNFYGTDNTPAWFAFMWVSACISCFIIGVWALVDPKGSSGLYKVLNFIPSLCTVYVLVNMLVVIALCTAGIALFFINAILKFIGFIRSE